MSGLQFVLADPGNEAHLRKLLRDNPLAGDLRVALEREPNAFHAAGISGDRYQLVLAYGQDGDRLLGTGARFEFDAFVNGSVRRLGYLGELRIDGGLKQRRRLLFEAYRDLRNYHDAGSAPYYLTTIIADNTSTRRLLEAGLSDMPTYRPLETMVTLTIPARAGARRRRGRLPLVRGDKVGMAGIANSLAIHGGDYQFFPYWDEAVLRSEDRCRGLSPSDFLVFEGHGCLALWDQRAFKQTVVRGYANRIARLRPAFNLVAPALGRPRLPGPGARLKSAFLSHVAVPPDDDEAVVALISQACRDAVSRDIDYVMLGLAERNPLAATVRARFPCHSYVSMIYVVYWEDGEAAAAELDDRIPHPEVAIL